MGRQKTLVGSASQKVLVGPAGKKLLVAEESSRGPAGKKRRGPAGKNALRQKLPHGPAGKNPLMGRQAKSSRWPGWPNRGGRAKRTCEAGSELRWRAMNPIAGRAASHPFRAEKASHLRCQRFLEISVGDQSETEGGRKRSRDEGPWAEIPGQAGPPEQDAGGADHEGMEKVESVRCIADRGGRSREPTFGAPSARGQGSSRYGQGSGKTVIERARERAGDVRKGRREQQARKPRSRTPQTPMSPIVTP